jgi:hypothetical protein
MKQDVMRMRRSLSGASRSVLHIEFNPRDHSATKS